MRDLTDFRRLLPSEVAAAAAAVATEPVFDSFYAIPVGGGIGWEIDFMGTTAEVRRLKQLDVKTFAALWGWKDGTRYLQILEGREGA